MKNVIDSVNEEQTTLAFRQDLQDLASIFGQYQEPMSWSMHINSTTFLSRPFHRPIYF